MDNCLVIPDEARRCLTTLIRLDDAIAKKDKSFQENVNRMIRCLQNVIKTTNERHAQALWTFLVEEKDKVRNNYKNLSQIESKSTMERWRRAMKKIIGQLKFQGNLFLCYVLFNLVFGILSFR
jgi:hypothetical protein